MKLGNWWMLFRKIKIKEHVTSTSTSTICITPFRWRRVVVCRETADILFCTSAAQHSSKQSSPSNSHNNPFRVNYIQYMTWKYFKAQFYFFLTHSLFTQVLKRQASLWNSNSRPPRIRIWNWYYRRLNKVKIRQNR